MKLTIAILALAFAAFIANTADNIIAGIMAYSYGTASHQGSNDG